ncbi:protein of unknown function DUF305 [Methylobacterium sp. 4-46]|uniref:DUF305 domain-containing protein n=1 Tax=unclassified Methylobacterium TaxID=2615210 RepID=UPI000152D1A5|nr:MULTISPECIES: DUF305 domain-containing protein [Methylobacterium]ACA16305.1 protein of unknown function DUF305 [Methylobacterium sp. 4-46]WFT82013.1 DUF305 domain-containing protein [Methylobacterium nodulans]
MAGPVAAPESGALPSRGAPLRAPAGLDWRAACLLGLVSSTFSTLVSQLAAARIGRDAAVDWMVVAAIPFRDPALQADPGWPAILGGILFHQWADLSWAVVFFGLLGRWTAGLRPGVLLALALPWALLTSASEWLLLVPAIPFRQPIFTLEQPYWIGFLVHVTSALCYPLFPWLRDRLARRPSPNARAAGLWAWLAGGFALALSVLAALGAQGREWPWAGRDRAGDQAFMRRMASHHAQGIVLARLAAERARDPHLRALARLIAAAQAGEVAILDQWWRSWFDSPLAVCGPRERAAMPGMLGEAEIDGLARAAPDAFDAAFVRLMTAHHRGAIAMADAALRGAGDLRVRLMAQAIRHNQRGEIELMRGREGLAATAAAIGNLVARLGAAPADGDQDPAPGAPQRAELPRAVLPQDP